MEPSSASKNEQHVKLDVDDDDDVLSVDHGKCNELDILDQAHSEMSNLMQDTSNQKLKREILVVLDRIDNKRFQLLRFKYANYINE